jgi:hypothetical protein
MAALATGIGAVVPANAASTLKPTLPEVEPKGLPRSRVPLVVGVELDWAKQQLQAAIPTLLYQEADREVAPGIWLDLAVTRGAIGIAVLDDRAAVSVPVAINLEARSKLGKIVLPLGHCRTNVDVELSLVSKLAADGKLQRPTTKANLREPCRLSGFDVTTFLQREIERRLAVADAPIDAHRERANALVAEIHRGLFQRLATPASGCLRFIPETLHQAPLVEQSGVALVRLEVEGTLANSCSLPPPASIVVEQPRTTNGFDLAWSQRVTLAGLCEQLSQRFVTHGFKGACSEIRAVRLDGIDQLALLIRVAKGQAWIIAQPIIRENKLVLDRMKSQNTRLFASVEPILAELALPVDTIAVESMARQLIQESNAAAQVFAQSLDLKERYATHESDLRTASEVLVDRDAVIVVVHRRQLPAVD